jgi:hypothetical protein
VCWVVAGVNCGVVKQSSAGRTAVPIPPCEPPAWQPILPRATASEVSRWVVRVLGVTFALARVEQHAPGRNVSLFLALGTMACQLHTVTGTASRSNHGPWGPLIVS